MENDKKMDIMPGHVGYSPDYKSQPPSPGFMGSPELVFRRAGPEAPPGPGRPGSAVKPTEEQLAASRRWLYNPGAEAVDDWADPDAVAPSLAALLAGRERGLVHEIAEFVAGVAEDWEPGRIAREIEAHWGHR